MGTTLDCRECKEPPQHIKHVDGDHEYQCVLCGKRGPREADDMVAWQGWNVLNRGSNNAA